MSRHRSTVKSRVFFATLLSIALLLMVSAVTLTAQGKQVCFERWECSEWGACSNGVQQRACTDLSACGTVRGKPDTSKACGAKTAAEKCGNSNCAATESCSSCPADCGKCAAAKTVVQAKTTLDDAAQEVANTPPANARIYPEPLGMDEADDLIEQGYVIIRYYYTPNCDSCREPVNIQKELTKLVSEQSDLIVLVSLNSISFPFDSERYAGVQGVVYPPSIRIDGMSDGVRGYGLLFGYSLVQNLQDGDLLDDLGPLICEHSDRCDFRGGKLVRNS